jgi:PadR family transcriptional regulator, regulatory protein PadR
MTPTPPADRELKRGVLELVLLRLLQDRPAYGYELVSEIARRTEGELEIKEGTLYPLLYRLEEQGLVATGWETPERGAPRKYYRITEAGLHDFAERTQRWRRFRDRVDTVLEMTGSQEKSEEE